MKLFEHTTRVFECLVQSVAMKARSGGGLAGFESASTPMLFPPYPFIIPSHSRGTDAAAESWNGEGVLPPAQHTFNHLATVAFFSFPFFFSK